MYKNHKKNYTMIQLLLILLFVYVPTRAMDEQSMQQGTQPMELCEATLFKQLMESSFNNDTHAVRRLIGHHDVLAATTETQWGTNPLCWAAFYGNTEMAQLLLDSGFELTVRENGSTPFHTAAYHKKHEVLRLFLTYAACPFKQTRITEIKELLWQKIKKLSNDGLLIPLQGIPARMIAYELCGQPNFESYAHALAIAHFERLHVLLASRTEIIGAQMTAYEAACEHQETQCKELLEPRGFVERFQEEIVRKYVHALHQAVAKEN